MQDHLTFDPAIHNHSFDPVQHPFLEWHWRAVSKDGTFLDEYGEGGPYGWKDISKDDLASFILIPQKPGLTWHQLKLAPDSRPIFFRRRHMEIAAPVGEDDELTVPQDGLDVRIHVLGFQQTIKGVNVQLLTAFFPDGSALVTDDIDGF